VSEREIFRLNGVPAYQNKMFDTRDAAAGCPYGDIVLVQDTETGLIFNTAYDPVKLSYDETYQNEQGHSLTFQTHMNEVIGKIDLHFSEKHILEVGCGKGGFLDLMRQHGHDAVGIDPAYEGSAPYIYKQHFNANLGINADAVVLRHVLEHVSKPLDFLRSIALANDYRGKIYIEVPSLDWIIERRSWFDVFYEHVNYFRLVDFERMFSVIHEIGHLFGGQYIYIIADLCSMRDPKLNNSPDLVNFPSNFMNAVESSLNLTYKSKRKIVWGAAAKGVMFSHHLMSHGFSLDFAIDINPSKQGKFMGGSALPVLSPASGLARLSAGDDVFVMNSNYIDEISALGGDHLTYILVDRQ